MMIRLTPGISWFLLTAVLSGLVSINSYAVDELDLSDAPLFLTQAQPPLNLLVMGRDHKLYYEAYNDASDLNKDGILDVRYDPDINYFGYFDSHKCYAYQSASNKFAPTGVTVNKKCPGSWSGDFLNYITTSRIDALRKVLYGGHRTVDTDQETVLARSYIPQDAHSWGKEYLSIEHDGYDIRDYTPLPLPVEGTDTRHLIANTTLLNDPDERPLVRILTNSKYRIWEWVSIERAVAGDRCEHGANGPACIADAVAGEPEKKEWEIVPPEAFSNLERTTYDLRRGLGGGSDDSSGSVNVPHPNNHAEFDAMISNYALETYKDGAGPVANIDGSGNPYGNNYDYLTVFSGELVIPETDTYRFAVNGDDAVEVIIDGEAVAGWYGGHGADGSDSSLDSHSGSKYLIAGSHTIEYRHEERWGGDSYEIYWEVTIPEKPAIPASTMTDYVVKVQVCNDSVGLEENCVAYGEGADIVYKPTGLLHDYGESEEMMFGLLSGSYASNLSGGVLRKAVTSFQDEVDPDTGQFTNVNGIVGTLDKLRTIGFGGNYKYNENCGWIIDGPITQGECRMWGNPIAEMMYEGVRYFAGKAAPTGVFNITATGNDDAILGLPLATWDDPYAEDNNKWCAKPFQTVISDINPSYDTDQIPGSAFADVSTGDLSPALDVASLGQTIWDGEMGGAKTVFIGQAGTCDTCVNDGAPTPKSASSFGDIRGLSPEEPTKLGGYYSASVAYYGLSNDINPVDGGVADKGQKMTTFAVALASPLPRIDIPVDNKTITLVPFAKSVGGIVDNNTISAKKGDFQPTNAIVDFYVETLEDDYGKFRINFEDVEQGADHDMDAIVTYEYQVNDDGTVDITLSSDYAAGSIQHHLGYVMSGTTADGIYLEVRDRDTGEGSDPDFFLDTPPGEPIGGVWQDDEALPLQATRRFTPGASDAAILLNDPLWYAAKWGGFEDDNDNGKPDLQKEWDLDADGSPDNYFLVTNALKLKDQLGKAFEEILAKTSSASSAAVNSGSINSNTRVYQARFNSGTWSGELLSFPIKDDGTLENVEWDAGEQVPEASARKIITVKADDTGVPFQWDDLSSAQQEALNTDLFGNVDSLGQQRLAYLRGDRSLEEQNGGAFRDRARLLGDIVHSEPEFVGAPAFFYGEKWASIEGQTAPENGGSETYPEFREANTNRAHMIYAGSNDGMLHGFNATTGKEEIAFVPGEVFGRLSALTYPEYGHRYYVDGSPTMGDAFFNNGSASGTWQTVLVGGLAKGGQGVYALNVTNPSAFSESNASSIVLWEFSDEDDADLGYSFSQPAIVRMRNGRWAAVFGNGYNNTEDDGCIDGDNNGLCGDGADQLLYSTTGNAVLYIVDIETGGDESAGGFRRKIDTGVGSAQDPIAGSSRPNGLATAVPVDVNRDSIVDYIYAGDTFGNLWKFDVTDTDSSNWDVAFSSGGTKLPLYVAMDGTDPSTSNRQPITSPPSIGRGPGGIGVMVYFGTGQYLQAIDKDVPTEVDDQRVQTFYGIVDNDVAFDPSINGRSGLQKQEILAEMLRTANGDRINMRITSKNMPSSLEGYNGWYIDLVSPTSGFQGELQVTRSVLRNGRVLFTTLIPSGDPCKFGGSGWLMGLDAMTGGRVDSEEPLFDLNGDDDFTEEDDTIKITLPDGTEVTVAISGKESDVGIIPTPALLSNTVVTHALTSGTSGEIQEHTLSFGPADFGRQSWQQLK